MINDNTKYTVKNNLEVKKTFSCSSLSQKVNLSDTFKQDWRRIHIIAEKQLLHAPSPLLWRVVTALWGCPWCAERSNLLNFDLSYTDICERSQSQLTNAWTERWTENQLLVSFNFQKCKIIKFASNWDQTKQIFAWRNISMHMQLRDFWLQRHWASKM